MKIRTWFGVGLLAALLSAGCALPQNSPLDHIAKIQPVFEPRTNVLPPAQMIMHPGPGVDGPGPGVMLAGYHAPIGPGVGMGAGGGPGGFAPCGAYPMMMAPPTSQIGFTGPDGMRIHWDVASHGMFDSEPLVVPGRFNFPQGAIYRLKLTDIPGYPGVELYPTLEVAPTVPRTEAFIAHNFIPFQLTDDDFKQVLSGNFVTKVIYLPDPQYQELALAGVETLVSTRLDPGVDPIVEADRRGSILAIIRIGNKDLQSGDGGGPEGDVVQAGYWGPIPCHHPAESIAAEVGQPTSPPPQFVAGMDVPEYGMPYCGTPIGLPGPPYVPLGVPAGLQRHIMTNETHMHIPPPTEQVNIRVAQIPGMSYPKPVDHVKIVETSAVPPVEFNQPCDVAHQVVPGAGGGCANGACQ
ncbi:MAG TPA: hypothetical protein VMJ32_13235 [Pirellulales bacterium]|nr:hypothetical protein [Pirellulales bacterium]